MFFQVQLVGPVGPRLLSMLDPTIQVPYQSKVSVDEVHVILQYGVGDVWGLNTAPVATRFITFYDESNSRASMLEILFDSLLEYEPDLVIISGRPNPIKVYIVNFIWKKNQSCSYFSFS